ncbi:hypothetical protein AB0B12_27605 [Streptomyces sp. NPDC044780]|uniref:hypothetical protein n=1 Tax=unclassified Streptomyces TaxID=2593676 RepID=UPI0033F40EE6
MADRLGRADGEPGAGQHRDEVGVPLVGRRQAEARSACAPSMSMRHSMVSGQWQPGQGPATVDADRSRAEPVHRADAAIAAPGHGTGPAYEVGAAAG